MKYRAEIDGLRAIAVVPVIFFHAGFEIFSGGFVGVDVFFVISGYLITTILIEDIENKRFSIVKFYKRRARRILPALFFVMLVCIPFAWMWMLPSHMKDFSRSLVAVSLSASNFLFWRESGYFESAAEEKPLLHTWSLAVEEQYYVLFPIFLVVAWRFGKNNVFWIIIVMASVSLLLSELAWRNDASANFYLPHTRAWELFAGSIAAFVVQKRGVRKNDVLSFLGVSAIIFSIFAYDESTPFPSVYTLVPVIGAVLIVLFGNKETIVARLLSLKIFVGFGVISYSAYLWHQPLFAFARIRLLQEPSLIIMLMLSVLSLLLAVLSWKYVEKPFRKTKKIKTEYVISLGVLGFSTVIIIGMTGHLQDGFKTRYQGSDLSLIISAESSPLNDKCHFPQKQESLERKACVYFAGIPSVAVLGNSHGSELAYALAESLENHGVAIIPHTMSGCTHVYQNENEVGSICYAWHQNVVAKLRDNETVQTIIVSYRNERELLNASYRDGLVKMIEAFINSKKKVIVVLQAPLPGAHIYKYISLALSSMTTSVMGLSRKEWEQTYNATNLLIAELPDDVDVIDPADIFCGKNDCLVIKDGKALYFDDNHMSRYGARLVADFIVAKYIEQ
ncbi:MAG: acyltransferase family protein [Proteobacteria bacterium]|nr:acyltransferase family protein [Pseudomonadota bacterium]